MSSLFRKEALENQKDNLMGDVLLLQPLSLAIMTGVCVLITAMILALLFWGSYARKETVRGYLTPDRGVVKVYPTNTGTLSKIHVKDGQKVRSGEVLFTIAAERQMASGNDVDKLLLQEIQQDLDELTHRIQSEKKLEIAEQERLSNQADGINNELKRIDHELELHKERVALSQNRVDSAKKLLHAKHMSANEYEKIYEDHLSLLQHQQELERTKLTKQNAYAEIKAQLEQLPFQVQARISDLQKALSDLRQRRFEIEGRRVFEIRAPVNGTVDALQVNEGQWLNNMQPSHLLAIIPEESTLLVELYVPTRAVGFIQAGQQVKIRYDAFPYQRYGIYEGQIESISHHILHPNELPVPLEIAEPVYRVIVRMKQQHIKAYAQEVSLQAGMSVEADIILEKQSLVRWLLDPLYSLRGRV